VKLLDFGVSKSDLSETHTRIGYVKGKPPYMSPEQCLQQRLDRRTDIFSLAVVLFEMATGTPLFRAASDDVAAMEQIVSGAYPRPSLRKPDLPEKLEQVILRALAPDVEDRYATADEFRIALADVAATIRPEPQSQLSRLVQLICGTEYGPELPVDEPTVVAPFAFDVEIGEEDGFEAEETTEVSDSEQERDDEADDNTVVSNLDEALQRESREPEPGVAPEMARRTATIGSGFRGPRRAPSEHGPKATGDEVSPMGTTSAAITAPRLARATPMPPAATPFPNLAPTAPSLRGNQQSRRISALLFVGAVLIAGGALALIFANQ
jgi:serine/threonine protein kinase